MPIGRADGNVFRCNMKVDVGGSFALRDNKCHFFPHGSITSYSLNGKRTTKEAIISPLTLNLFVLEGGCFICWVGENSQLPDFARFNIHEWFVYSKVTTQWQGPMKLQDLADLRADAAADALVVFNGLTSCAFMLKDMIEVSEFVRGGCFATQEPSRRTQPAPSSGSIDIQKEICCPHCWQRFQLSHSLAIAVHPKLCGDSILGEDAQQRFTPVKVDSHGMPVDAMGMSVREFACPWCHHKLQPFFSRTNQHVFSLIGIPAAGKTYYLSCMLHELEYALPREFGIAFRDADPSSNSPLNSMRMRLFSANSPQDAYLDKTRQQGHLYHKVWRNSRFATLPRPFIYNLSKGKVTHSLVLYDAAGEDCEPGELGQEHSAGHLAVASAIFFLFDPTSDASFRKLIYEEEDPQLKQGVHMQERQALMLSETEIRLRTARRLMPEQNLDIPLAVIIGKSDTWQKLLGQEPLLPSIRNGQFQPKLVDANSKRLRQLLFDIAPHICANAEAISTNVRYFAASSFGAAPEAFKDERTGDTLLAPAGGKVRPNRVIDPVLWALHCKEPGLLSKPRS